MPCVEFWADIEGMTAKQRMHYVRTRNNNEGDLAGAVSTAVARAMRDVIKEILLQRAPEPPTAVAPSPYPQPIVSDAAPSVSRLDNLTSVAEYLVPQVAVHVAP